jgi:hypothetical protein
MVPVFGATGRHGAVGALPSWWLLSHGGLVWVIHMDVASLMEVSSPGSCRKSPRYCHVVRCLDGSRMVVHPSRLPFGVVHLHPSCGGSSVCVDWFNDRVSMQRAPESFHRR